MEKEKQQTLDCWAIVELMGHQRIAGRVTERNVAGTQMLQVDVPEHGDRPAFTRMLGGAAVYAINPCEEEIARTWAASISESASPITSFEGQRLIGKLVEKRLAALPAGNADKECANCYHKLSQEEVDTGASICSACVNANDADDDRSEVLGPLPGSRALTPDEIEMLRADMARGKSQTDTEQ